MVGECVPLVPVLPLDQSRGVGHICKVSAFRGWSEDSKMPGQTEHLSLQQGSRDYRDYCPDLQPSEEFTCSSSCCEVQACSNGALGKHGRTA